MLRSYTDLDFDLLKGWVTSADLLLQYSGTDFSYPLTRSQFSTYQQKYPDRLFYIGYTVDNQPYAFGEIIPQESGIPRLARILIGEPNLRGVGLGKYFIHLLMKECTNRFEHPNVELFVWDKNLAAIRCYESVGFVYNPVKEKILIHENESYAIHKMTYAEN
ncbi:MAG: GNAT family N-acetyltransferase [Pyrinomonadaceae bacterium]|nr:GNAT family N-acetyltransferase [Sphingobacteriaceae bacterium]